LLYKITIFTGLMRRAGLRAASSEVLDFARALCILGTDRDSFRLAMQATLIKQQADAAVLERLSDLFWESFVRLDEMPPGKRAEFIFQKKVQNFRAATAKPSVSPRPAPGPLPVP